MTAPTVDSLLAGVAQCATCGVEYPAARRPDLCPICADERQYLPPDGKQRWVLPGDYPDARISLTQTEPGLWHLHHKATPGIGQAPLVVATEAGNVMIEAPTHLDDDAVARVREIGGLAGILASHPHMYGLQSLWSAAFDDCPVYISAADERWLGLRPRNTVVWGGELRLAEDLVASQPGGHFPGSVVAHWRGADGRGVLLTGDTIAPVSAAGWVTFMRSYPNKIPLSAAVVARIARHVARYDYDRLYGNFATSVSGDAAACVQRSAARYCAWVSGANDHLT